MARPRVFISSTFYDLKHIRSSLEDFIERLGYEAVLSEKGRIAYDPDIPLDESCYKEALSSDILVLIIGGRYGSAASGEDLKDRPNFYDRYVSITKKEYDVAFNRDIPVYVLVEKNVFAEYETYKKNKDNETIEFAHVDSINVFKLLEEILAKARNNPLHQFERYPEIEEWLREQFAGLFRELISRRSDQKQLSSLSERIAELSSINSSLQRYMEAVISSVSKTPGEADKLIQSEKERVDAERARREFENTELAKYLMEADYSIEKVEEIVRAAKSIEDLADSVSKVPSALKKKPLIDYWRKSPRYLNDFKKARNALGLTPLIFETSSDVEKTQQKDEGNKQ